MAGYDIYTATAEKFRGSCWISDLGRRLEVTIDYCVTDNVWIGEEKKISEFEPDYKNLYEELSNRFESLLLENNTLKEIVKGISTLL